jgi:hypothetical protein
MAPLKQTTCLVKAQTDQVTPPARSLPSNAADCEWMMDRNEYGILPHFFQLLRVTVPDDVAPKSLHTITPADWRERPEFTRDLGDAWLASRETALAQVSSAIAPQTWNYLLNPAHPDAQQVENVEVVKERFDNRLLRFGSG